MKYSTVLFPAFCLLLTMQACRKIAQIKKETKNAITSSFDFQTNSYWVYLDSLTSTADSFTVTHCQNKLKLDNLSGTDIDELSLTIMDYNSLNSNAEIFTWRLVLGTSSVAFYIDDPKTANYGYTGKVFSYPFKDDYFETVVNGKYNAYSKLIKIYPSLTINGVCFTNVAQIHLFTSSDVPGSPYVQNDFIYVCAEKGIVKMDIDHPLDGLRKSWDLLRFQVAL